MLHSEAAPALPMKHPAREASRQKKAIRRHPALVRLSIVFPTSAKRKGAMLSHRPVSVLANAIALEAIVYEQFDLPWVLREVLVDVSDRSVRS